MLGERERTASSIRRYTNVNAHALVINERGTSSYTIAMSLVWDHTSYKFRQRRHHVNQIIADACIFFPEGFAYIFAELDFH